jgi:hypothetical protein
MAGLSESKCRIRVMAPEVCRTEVRVECKKPPKEAYRIQTSERNNATIIVGQKLSSRTSRRKLLTT